jgi:hypothetical protein
MLPRPDRTAASICFTWIPTRLACDPSRQEQTKAPFPSCVGIVAAELIVFPGVPSAATQLSNVELSHPGTDSNTGCGGNSTYDVWRTVLTGLTTTELNA